MKCREALKLLYEYLDKQLDKKSVDEVQEHLSECKHCFEQYQFEEQLNDLIKLKSVEDPRKADAVVEKLKTNVRTAITRMSCENGKQETDEGRGGFFLFRRPVLAVGFFAVIAILGLAFYLSNSNQSAWAKPFIESHESALKGENKMDIMAEDPSLIDSCLSSKMLLPRHVFTSDSNCHPIMGRVELSDEHPYAQIVYDVHNQDVSIFVLAKSVYSVPENLKPVKDYEDLYFASFKGKPILVWDCAAYWYIATGNVDEDRFIDFASQFN